MSDRRNRRGPSTSWRRSCRATPSERRDREGGFDVCLSGPSRRTRPGSSFRSRPRQSAVFPSGVQEPSTSDHGRRTRPERRDQRGGGSAVFLSTLVDTNTSHAWGRLLPGFGRYGHGGRYPAPRVVPANPNVDGSSRTRSRDGESESPPPLGESRIRPVPYVPTQSALRFGVRPARGPPATAARGDGGAARAGPPAEDHSFPRSASPTEREKKKKSASAAGPRPPAPAPGEGRRAARRDPHPPGAPGATWLILPVTYACLKD